MSHLSQTGRQHSHPMNHGVQVPLTQTQHSKWRQNTQEYPIVHWDAVYISQKYYIGHPLTLDKLIKLQQQIRVQKSKLNIISRWDQTALNTNNNTSHVAQKHDQTIQSDHPSTNKHQKFRLDSALSRQCKTQINQVNQLKQLKTRAEIQKQLLIEEQKYKHKLDEMKRKRSDKLNQNPGNQFVIRNSHHSKANSKGSKANSQADNKSKNSKKSSVFHNSNLVAPHQLNLLNNSQHNSRVNLQNKSHRYNIDDINNDNKMNNSNNGDKNKQVNFVSFQPNKSQASNTNRNKQLKNSGQEYNAYLKEGDSIRINHDQKSKHNDKVSSSSHHGKISNNDKSRKVPNINKSQQISIQDRNNNSKSFVINYRRTPSHSKSKQLSEHNHEINNSQLKAISNKNRRDLQSASSIGSKMQIQKINRKIKQMQEKLQLIEIRQDQIRNIEYSRIRESRIRLKNAEHLSQDRRFNTQEDVDVLASPEEMQRNHHYQNHHQQKQPEHLITNENNYEQQLPQSPDNNKNNNNNKQSKQHKNNEIPKEQQSYSISIKPRLDFSSSIINYNYMEDMQTLRKKQLEVIQKDHMNQEINQLKKIIRELKLERIHHQSIIDQLENREKEKEKQMMRVTNFVNNIGNNNNNNISNNNSLNNTYNNNNKNNNSFKGNNSLLKNNNMSNVFDSHNNTNNNIQNNSLPQKNQVEDIPIQSRNKLPQDHTIQQSDKPSHSKFSNTHKSPKIQTGKQISYDHPHSHSHPQQSNEKQFVRSQMKKNDSSDFPIPRKENHLKTSLDSRKIGPLSIDTKSHQNRSKQMNNPQDMPINNFHVGKQGIIVRQVNKDDELEEGKRQYTEKDPNSYYQNFTNFTQKNLPHKEMSVEPSSPTQTGKKIFQLEFIRENKYELKEVEDWPHLSPPNIKIKGFEIPDLPNPPSPDITQQQLLKLSDQVCNIFDIKVSDKELYMKKYKNCVIFKIPDSKKTVVWHYNGKFYIGGWEQNHLGEGKKTGQGFQYYPDKYYYQGQFYEGKKNGSGVMISISPHKTVYNGQWFEGEKHGIGTYYDSAEGSSYEGEFLYNKKQGKGVLKLSDTEFYDGTFSKSIKHGYGIQKFSNGDIFKGEYKNGRFHGLGKYFWANGSSYDGHFVEGHREGSGKWRSARISGDAYSGEYKKDKKQGRGQYIWTNGCKYDGLFHNDLKHGDGRVEYPDGRQIRGNWQNGKLIEIQQTIVQNSDGNSSQQPLKKPKYNQIFETPSKQLRNSKYLHKI